MKYNNEISVPDDIDEEIILNKFEENLSQINSLYSKKFKFQLKSKKMKPWLLMIGPEDSGKSSLIVNSHINISHTLQQSNSKNRIWITDDNIIINTPSYFIQNPIKSFFWKKLFQILKIYKKKQPCDGVLLVLNISQLILKPKVYKEILFSQISGILNILNTRLSHRVPINLIFTHLDNIKGFKSYFNDLSKEELENPFGLEIYDSDIENIDLIIKKQLDIFYNKLNKRLLWKLQNSNEYSDKASSHNFTLQMQSVEKIIMDLKNVISKKRCVLNGVFFTSSLQKGGEINCIDNKLHTIAEQEITKNKVNIDKDQSYFVKNILYSINYNINNKHQLKSGIKKYAYSFKKLIAFTILIALSTYCFTIIKRDLQTIYAINGIILSLPNNYSNEDIIKNVNALLNPVKILSNKFNYIPKYINNDFILGNVNDLQIISDNYYTNILNFAILPYFKITLEELLLQNNSLLDSFNYLKAYLMLGQIKHRDIKYLEKIISNNLQGNIKNKSIFLASLYEAFSKKKTIMLNQSILNSIWSQFNENNLSDVVYKMAIETYKNHQNYSEFINLPYISNVACGNIPNIYNIFEYKKIRNIKIPSICNQLKSDMWVLESKTSIKSNADVNKIIKDTQNRYDKVYDTWWNEQESWWFNHDKPTSVQMVYNLLNQWESHIESIQKIKLQKQLNNKENTIINKQYTSMKMYALLGAIQDLKLFYRKVMLSDYPEEEIFKNYTISFPKIYDVIRLMSYSYLFTQPVRSKFISFINDVNTFNTFLIKKYINNQWNKIVYKKYKSSIFSHYPIKHNASKNISKEMFVNFFGKSGEINNFLQNYITPFYDTQLDKWNIKNHGFYINEKIISQFKRVKTIENMFFKNGTLNLRFKINSLKSPNNVKLATINVNNQEINPSSKMLDFLDWPNNNTNTMFKINITTETNKVYSLQEKGLWGMFRILDISNVVEKNARNYTIKFNITSFESLEYQLEWESNINPLNSNVLKDFTLSPYIFDSIPYKKIN